jgi:hypothetical protein
MDHSRLATAICVLSLSSAAIAQEEGTVPGSIPDPSSYQGSMVLQQQSDAQDQQFRAEQQSSGSSQSYQQPSYSGGGGQSGGYQSYSSGGSSGRVSRPAPPLNPLAAAFQRGDYVTVLKILRPAAAAGNPSAEHNLGFMYEKGYGVPRNPTVAANWYRKSANQGNPAGQLALGRLYYLGAGVQRDLVEAYKWMYLAGRGTSKAFPYINLIGRMLTYDQMSEAMRRGQMWTPGGH